ncbi:bifunctional adenosylcobinamide kinase/adenosylcobinamide-phosphate guanylyltransferase [Vibrio sinensis]|uniref:Bifunctional adenosylcobalamin biosynthesis protein n=1 Tax=Vibrio sinensis TaxID=2302434 RepID=A0A3A6QJB3_9VIBR|nr:bifunctional adenosylcobinamide kinase/adenosylcobinamide-phosphate guanylyltransferase [Vibrio sinensis]RJX72920.1 bifunctional adenosylcobinamide kinase/adenosylcobinamide-phosphate guanylyltransferase [Vibrio sinensis]
MSVHLILGGARSGKSSFAEAQAVLQAGDHSRHYIATAMSTDDEMQQRIEHHQRSRDDRWQLYECPLDLASALMNFQQGDVVLVDCLTLWLNNVIFTQGEQASESEIRRHVQELIEALTQSHAHLFLVSNEVGLGIIPMGEVTRLFVDHAGWMNQGIARIAQQVTFVAAGLPMSLKNEPESDS